MAPCVIRLEAEDGDGVGRGIVVTPDYMLRVVTIFSARMLGKLLKLLKFNGDGWGTRIPPSSIQSAISPVVTAFLPQAADSPGTC